MFSLTRTGTCWRPLCTAMVRPTISGRIIERRDQVLIGLRLFVATASCTFFARCGSTKGPLCTERGTLSYLHLISLTWPCGRERSCCWYACSCASCNPWSAHPRRSEEHTSELQSRENLVCRL